MATTMLGAGEGLTPNSLPCADVRRPISAVGGRVLWEELVVCLMWTENTVPTAFAVLCSPGASRPLYSPARTDSTLDVSQKQRVLPSVALRVDRSNGKETKTDTTALTPSVSLVLFLDQPCYFQIKKKKIKMSLLFLGILAELCRATTLVC